MNGAAFLAAIAFIGSGLGQAAFLSRPRAFIHSGADSLLESYDYVIIGGGTSGLTVADRLTEDGKTTVLVVESGPFVNKATPSTSSATVSAGMATLPGGTPISQRLTKSCSEGERP